MKRMLWVLLFAGLLLTLTLGTVAGVGAAQVGPDYQAPAAIAAPEAVVTMTVSVTLPNTTPPGDAIYIAGSFQSWDPGATPLNRDGLHASGTITVTEGETLEFKFTRGSWETVEKGPICEEIANRTAQAEAGGSIEATVVKWADLCEAPFFDTRIQTVTLESEALGVTKQFYLYTPPGYDENAEARYPVLYLFRGHEREWVNPYEDGTRAGTNVIDVYETLLEAGDVGPMILVFPGISSADNSVSGLLTDFQHPELVPEDDQPSVGTGQFESYFINDVIPYVDATYRTVATREGRGVDGFSLGGFMSAKIAAEHPDLFRTVGAFDGTYLYADPTCQLISPQDTLFYNPQNDWLYGPAFGPFPTRDSAYAAENNAPNIVCNSTPEAMQSLTWLIQYGPESSEPTDANYLRGAHLMGHLEAKGVTNGLEPVLAGGHNWRTADEHMRQTLPLHYTAFQSPTAVTVEALGAASAPVPMSLWLAGAGVLAGSGWLVTRKRSTR
ncbi:MAG TPA: alpha/beta hydrolase-fold protein [Ardenticatenaceae bacterium]